MRRVFASRAEGDRSSADEDRSLVERDGSFALGYRSWQKAAHDVIPPRVLLHLGRDRPCAVDPEDVCFLEAVGETTLLRSRSARRVRDVRAVGDLLKALPGADFIRAHRNHAINVRHVVEVRRRSAQRDWEVKLEPRVNRVLPVGRTHLAQLAIRPAGC